MAQFGWPTLIKTAAITAIVTSGLWVSAGLVWYYRSGPGQAAAVTEVGSEPAVAVLSHDGPPVITQGAAAQGGALIKTSVVTSAAPVAFTDPSTLIIPVAGVRPSDLVNTFTQSRSGGRVHDAIDIMAPKGTPPEVQAAAIEAFRKATQDPEAKTVWAAQGADFPNVTGAQFGKLIHDEIRKWADVVKASGAKLE